MPDASSFAGRIGLVWARASLRLRLVHAFLEQATVARAQRAARKAANSRGRVRRCNSECPLSRQVLHAKRACSRHCESDVHAPGRHPAATVLLTLALGRLCNVSEQLPSEEVSPK